MNMNTPVASRLRKQGITAATVLGDAVDAQNGRAESVNEDDKDSQISVRMLLLHLIGALTVHMAFHQQELGVAIGVGAVVVALVHQLLGR
ncbi:hypothetical protein [Streptomyces sp. NPDC001165]|uniref:hypothetical protein n=1 Tax=Streptomyces sp. NPDC001165 TaxID=3364546 RepID=UPI0036B704F5